jgi:hypothetical protein
MYAIVMAALLLGAPANGTRKIHCSDGTWQAQGRNACKRHGGPGLDKPAGKRPVAGTRSQRSDTRATAICRDSTVGRGELDQYACKGHGGVKEPL